MTQTQIAQKQRATKIINKFHSVTTSAIVCRRCAALMVSEIIEINKELLSVIPELIIKQRIADEIEYWKKVKQIILT